MDNFQLVCVAYCVKVRGDWHVNLCWLCRLILILQL